MYYGKRAILGEIQYSRQKRFIVRKGTKIGEFRGWMVAKLGHGGGSGGWGEGKGGEKMSYQLIYRNKLLVGNNEDCVGDLAKI